MRAVWPVDAPRLRGFAVAATVACAAIAVAPHGDRERDATGDERARLAHRAAVSDWFAEYRDVDELNAYLDRLAGDPAGLATVRRLGASVEGQPIRALEVSRGGPIHVALTGGQHAREWISVMVPICIADRLVARADEPHIRRVLDEISFSIVPLVNPDGYRYTWRSDRSWRKNRRGGYGVDLNRNYGVAWGESGSSADRASPNYRGEHPFSEPETQAVRHLFETTSIAAHLDFHSFSQVIVYPWSHQRAAPPDREAFAAIADRMRRAIRAARGEDYTVRPGADLQARYGGALADWGYGEHGTLSLLVELRPARGPEGFILPPEQIGPTCDEALAAVLALSDWLIEARR